MKKYRFYIYRDLFYPGEPPPPETEEVETDDPQAWAEKRCKGAIDSIEWDEVKE